jgi:type II secretory ATPase GspE/PulE/Tfp pilus assembly ATPase PilB-like protein
MHKNTSVWQKLRQQKIPSCEDALGLMVSPDGHLNLDTLDDDLNRRFFREFEDRASLPPLVPLLLWRNCFYLGSPYPLNDEHIQAIAERTLTEIKILSISAKSYSQWFRRQNIPDPNAIHAAPSVNPLTGEIESVDITEVTDLYLSQAVDQTRRINALISVALQHRASDIHLEPTTAGLRVRYRIDGILRDAKLLPLEISRRIIVALKVMSNMDIAESRRPQDGRIGKEYTNNAQFEQQLDLRVSTLPCVGGEKAVIRLLPTVNPFSNRLETLGFSAAALPTYESWLRQPQGLIIMTGPTGSGKTSTLYTSLQAVATEHVNVVTVEDPVEYVLPNITQTQVHELAGMTFAAGLRAILRQDPDIVMVGEVRDSETAETVVRAALTGHLVLSTMHTNDAVSAVPRLKDLGPDPGLVSDALLGIVAQRLVRRICPDCAAPYEPTAAELGTLNLKPNMVDLSQWRKGKGCPRCLHTGYIGREAVVEIIDVDDEFRQLIYEGTITQINQHLNKNRKNDRRFIPFRRSALEKLVKGVTTIEEILRVIPRNSLLRNI